MQRPAAPAPRTTSGNSATAERPRSRTGTEVPPGGKIPSNGAARVSSAHDERARSLTRSEVVGKRSSTGSNNAAHPPPIDERAATGSSAAAPSLKGTIIAQKFLIGDLLGEGGMGQVYKAEHLSLDKPVCVKILRPQLVTNATVVARFEREAKSASKLNHPNSIQVLDYGRFGDGGFYIAMEYVEGRDLAALLAEEWPLPEARTCHIVAQVLGALSAAHAAKVIHRDLKPENVMLMKLADDPDFVKVLDFGIAKMMVPDENEAVLTRADLVCGTPQYMSPEQATGANVDGRSDLYAVGCMLYRMVTGVLPFEGKNPMDYLNKHATERPVPPHMRRTDVHISPSLDRLIMRVLEKDPNKRPQTADEFRKELLDIETLAKAEALTGRSEAMEVSRGVEALELDQPEGGSYQPSRSNGVDLAAAKRAAISDSSELMLAQPERSYVNVNEPDPHDLTAAVRAYRKNYAQQRSRRIAGTLAGVIVVVAIGVVAYPMLPADVRKSIAEFTGDVTSGFSELLKAGEVKGRKGDKGKADDDDDAPKGGAPSPAGGNAGAAAVPIVAADPSRCPDGMIYIPSGKAPFCIDKYEFPNRFGAQPKLGVDWAGAKEACKSRGGRLCSQSEWERACRGPDNSSFSAAGTTDIGTCNTADASGNARNVTASGSQKGCVSGYGVADMSGNAAEWTQTSSGNGGQMRVIAGGSAADPSAATACNTTQAEAVESKSDLIGFRCCEASQ